MSSVAYLKEREESRKASTDALIQMTASSDEFAERATQIMVDALTRKNTRKNRKVVAVKASGKCCVKGCSEPQFNRLNCKLHYNQFSYARRIVLKLHGIRAARAWEKKQQDRGRVGPSMRGRVRKHRNELLDEVA